MVRGQYLKLWQRASIGLWLPLCLTLVSVGCGGGGGGDDDSTGDDDVTESPTPAADSDGDGVSDSSDNCPDTVNADQTDTDGDGTGDACDTEVCDGVDNNGDGQVDEGFGDSDGDGQSDCMDDCPNDADNDVDQDGKCGDVDNCPDMANGNQADSDGDGQGNVCDPCPDDEEDDADSDGVCGSTDNCPTQANEDQLDADGDGIGDVCDACANDPDNDADGDGICGDVDNCPDLATENISDTDGDGFGDECDNCPEIATDDTTDSDGDGIGDQCDACSFDPDNDVDADGVCGDVDLCPNTYEDDQIDEDLDGLGDACDVCPGDASNDPDKDGICGAVDNCPDATNENQMDRDRDGVGDVCDPCPDDSPDDEDGDGVCGSEEAIDNPDATFSIYGSFPDEGHTAVALYPLGKVFFSEPYAGPDEKVHIQIVSQYADEDPMTLDPIFTSDRDEVRFYPTVDLQPDSDYCLIIEIDQDEQVNASWPLRHVGCFSTWIPCGVTVDVGNETKIMELGDTGQIGLTTLNGYFQEAGNDYPVVFLMEDLVLTDTFPLEYTGRIGAYEVDADTGANILQVEGYGAQLDGCSVDELGEMICTTQEMVFPIYQAEYGTKFNLYVYDVTILATVITSGDITTFDGFDLEGIITEESIARIEAESGYNVGAVIELNVDTDADGIMDAATFALATQPLPLTLQDAACAGE